MSDRTYQLFERQQRDRGIDLDQVIAKCKTLEIETPSWGYGDSGTRFKVFQKGGFHGILLKKLKMPLKCIV